MFQWILCLAEDSLETSSLIFSEKQWKNIYECRLLQSCLALQCLIRLPYNILIVRLYGYQNTVFFFPLSFMHFCASIKSQWFVVKKSKPKIPSFTISVNKTLCWIICEPICNLCLLKFFMLMYRKKNTSFVLYSVFNVQFLNVLILTLLCVQFI